MTKHNGTSFYNSCVKVPVNPFSRQPSPSYERLRGGTSRSDSTICDRYDINMSKNYDLVNVKTKPKTLVDNFLDFLESIPDYDEVHHLSNEQFKQTVDHLKKRQNALLNTLYNSIAECDYECLYKISTSKHNAKLRSNGKISNNDLTLNGKKCYLQESKISPPTHLLSNKSTEQPIVVTNESCFTDRFKGCRKNDIDKELFADIMCMPNSNFNAWDELSSQDDLESDIDNIETRSLPATINKGWQPTLLKPLNFTSRKNIDKPAIKFANGRHLNSGKKNPHRRRYVRPVPHTSKVPLYDKILAEKKERSRVVRENRTLNLMSQIKPFKLECDRRAWKSLTRSSPEIQTESNNVHTMFKAKPVPKNLFSCDIYDRMLENEYYRHLQKKVRAAQLMKSSSLPPSMAKREYVKSSCRRLKNIAKCCHNNIDLKNGFLNNTSLSVDKCKCMMSLLPLQGNNLAAILRCQVSRAKLECDIREKMEEKQREQEAKLRESLTGRKPVWRALRTATGQEHEKDLSIRTSLRRGEARELAERHRVQMEMMLDRVKRIPTLFERHSQGYQLLSKIPPKVNESKRPRRKKKRTEYKQPSNSVYSSKGYTNILRSDSSSNISSISVPASQYSGLSKISLSQMTEKTITQPVIPIAKKKLVHN